MPEDGQADPVGVTNVLAKAARQKGVLKYYEKTPVTKILVKNNRINWCGDSLMERLIVST